LEFHGTRRGTVVASGSLLCRTCRTGWSVRNGLPYLFNEELIRGTDRLMRGIYDALPALHDPAVRWTLPLFQQGGTEEQLRSRYLERLELGALKPADPQAPVRILETGVGTGANLERVLDALPDGVAVEYWGIDLSTGMLGHCSQRVARRGLDRRASIRLLLADAHRLPFADHSFERVFHVGGIGAFEDPAAALAEMARVSRPGTPILAVDEELDPQRNHNLLARLAFRAITFYDEDPHCPVEHLPDDVTDVRAENISPFFYCFSFRAGSPPGIRRAKPS
jgi:ubiquinone/menaquinone biosynthesis C-methylase UbiE/uncharacterized protein YbaR (Trm112 family)